MELKEVILSTLAEMEEEVDETETAASASYDETTRPVEEPESESTPAASFSQGSPEEILEDECRYLESVKERLLVLFEGFQSPNNSHIEAKVDLTLNFLEYLLATIDTRIDKIKKSGR
jgi:hypothetical protein